MENFVLNIGRQLGSGGREIGMLVAKKLNIAYYDKELILIASKESGLGKEIFEQADEKKSTFKFGKNFWGGGNSLSNYYVSNYLHGESLFKIQSDVIKGLAAKQSCLFVGRCADYVLRNHPHCINIFISADADTRINRLIYRQIIESPERAQDLISKTDKKRAQYYNYYTNKEWGMASSYHLCIDSSILGVEKTADFIIAFVKEKLGI
ncbi:MAG: cytidylate kinase-like family protein [Dysgonamonadaceae bacterium]|jgi:shikimate kinase|nr:cytidylate kinase-like family protein [Dysgonamonadaceae bacterium]